MRNRIALALTLALLILAMAGWKDSRSAERGERCSLKLDASPELRGFRLGMTDTEADKLLPPHAADSADIKAYSFSDLELVKSGAPRFEGVKGLVISFLDSRAYALDVEYGGTTWRGPDEFAAKLSETFNLPPKAWQGVVMKTMLCDGFKVEALALRYSSHIRLTDPARQAEAEDRKRTGFKP